MEKPVQARPSSVVVQQQMRQNLWRAFVKQKPLYRVSSLNTVFPVQSLSAD
jgi:hypothetical protein